MLEAWEQHIIEKMIDRRFTRDMARALKQELRHETTATLYYKDRVYTVCLLRTEHATAVVGCAKRNPRDLYDVPTLGRTLAFRAAVNNWLKPYVVDQAVLEHDERDGAAKFYEEQRKARDEGVFGRFAKSERNSRVDSPERYVHAAFNGAVLCGIPYKDAATDKYDSERVNCPICLDVEQPVPGVGMIALRELREAWAKTRKAEAAVRSAQKAPPLKRARTQETIPKGNSVLHALRNADVLWCGAPISERHVSLVSCVTCMPCLDAMTSHAGPIHLEDRGTKATDAADSDSFSDD